MKRLALLAALSLASFAVNGQTLSVSPASGESRAPSKPTLTWDFAGGSNCVATGNWSGAKASSGTLTLGDFPAGTHTFSLSCSFQGTPVIGSATLSWVPPTANTDGSALTDLAGYRVLYGASATSLTQVIQIANPSVSTYTVQNLTSGTWYFAVRAYNSSDKESANSNVVPKTIPSALPQTVTKTVTWTVLPTAIPNPPTNLTVAEEPVAGLGYSPVFKYTSAYKRSAEVAGFVPAGTPCEGGVMFYFREKPFRRVRADDVRWWPPIVPSTNVVAQCRPS